MSGHLLFSDGSVNPKTGVGFGAYLFMDDSMGDIRELEDRVRIEKFENTSSTKLELQSLLWALDLVKDHVGKLTVYSDSQNILGLNRRRERLEGRAFVSKSGKAIVNADLYRAYYKLVDQMEFEICKVEGHKARMKKDHIDRCFSIVDRASRRAQREFSKG